MEIPSSEKGDSREERHSAWVGGGNQRTGLAKQKFIDVQVPAGGGIFEKGECTDQGSGRSEGACKHAPDFALLVRRPKRRACGQKCQRRIRFHGNVIGADALEKRDIRHPTEQHQRS